MKIKLQELRKLIREEIQNVSKARFISFDELIRKFPNEIVKYDLEFAKMSGRSLKQLYSIVPEDYEFLEYKNRPYINTDPVGENVLYTITNDGVWDATMDSPEYDIPDEAWPEQNN
jgi:hypothetical protein